MLKEYRLVLKQLILMSPTKTNSPENTSAENIHAIGSFSIKTLSPGTCVLPVINLVNAKVAPLKINSIARVTIKEGNPVLTTKIPFV